MHNINPFQTSEGVFHVHDYTMPSKIEVKRERKLVPIVVGEM